MQTRTPPPPLTTVPVLDVLKHQCSGAGRCILSQCLVPLRSRLREEEVRQLVHQMAFNLDELFEFCMLAINRFAAAYQDEVFYGFAIDASLLCLSSEEAFAQTLKDCQESWDRKHRPITRWEELTNEDLQHEEFLLDLCARLDGLDRSDRNACLRTINESRSRFREDGNPYRKREKIRELRENTGDWAYQGFADLDNCPGFDRQAYAAHYDMPDEEQKTSTYGTAMDTLVQRLRVAGAFASLKTTPEFYATRVEHNY